MAEQPILLEVKNIIKDYGGGPVLNDVSLQIHKGEVIVLIGPSGCGKSTFLRCINLLEQPTAGKVYIDGQEIGKSLRKEKPTGLRSDKKLVWSFKIMSYSHT